MAKVVHLSQNRMANRTGNSCQHRRTSRLQFRNPWGPSAPFCHATGTHSPGIDGFRRMAPFHWIFFPCQRGFSSGHIKICIRVIYVPSICHKLRRICFTVAVLEMFDCTWQYLVAEIGVCVRWIISGQGAWGGGCSLTYITYILFVYIYIYVCVVKNM